MLVLASHAPQDRCRFCVLRRARLLEADPGQCNQVGFGGHGSSPLYERPPRRLHDAIRSREDCDAGHRVAAEPDFFGSLQAWRRRRDLRVQALEGGNVLLHLRVSMRCSRASPRHTAFSR
jgi:hypothetical protein